MECDVAVSETHGACPCVGNPATGDVGLALRGSPAELCRGGGGVTFCLQAELVGMSVLDSTIVRRVLAGDVEAFSLLVDRHHARCLTVAGGLLGDLDDAEDAVQETFVRAYRHLGGYRESERFGAWILRILVNQCRTHRSRGARYERSDSFDALLGPGDSADAALHGAEQRLELMRALAHLAREQREAVVLRFAEELTFQEMAAVTGVGVSALKMRVQRACAQLRALLPEYLHA